MDPVALDRAMGILRLRIDIYLHHIMHLLRIREQPFLPVPFPDDPTRLPPSFPDGDCIHTTRIEWVERNVQYEYEVKLRHFDAEPDDRTVTWEILIKPWVSSEPRARIGLLEVDKELYYDRELFRFTGLFVLNTLRRSVLSATPIRVRRTEIASVQGSLPNNQPPTPQTSVEVVQMYDIDGHILDELARREL